MRNDTEEIWKDIEGYEGLYQVSNLGRVKSSPNRYQSKFMRNNGGIMKLKNSQGYRLVTLYSSINHSRKTFMVHRLVAVAFVKNDSPREKIFVNHKDENGANNRSDNLEWCTHKYNINYGSRSKRAAIKQSRKVAKYSLDGELLKVYDSFHEASADANINWGHISQVCQGKRNKAGGFKWKYAQNR